LVKSTKISDLIEKSTKIDDFIHHK